MFPISAQCPSRSNLGFLLICSCKIGFFHGLHGQRYDRTVIFLIFEHNLSFWSPVRQQNLCRRTTMEAVAPCPPCARSTTSLSRARRSRKSEGNIITDGSLAFEIAIRYPANSYKPPSFFDGFKEWDLLGFWP